MNTRENVRLTFDQKVEHVIQEIVDSNFELYKRITDDRAFGEAIKNFLFDQYLRAHRNAEELIKRGESKTLEFKSTLRWNLKEDRQDDKGVTHAVLKTDRGVPEHRGRRPPDRRCRRSARSSASSATSSRATTSSCGTWRRSSAMAWAIAPGPASIRRRRSCEGKTVCVVSCQRSPEPVFLKWKGMEAAADGDFFVRSGPGTVKLPPESARKYVRTRFPGFLDTLDEER